MSLWPSFSLVGLFGSSCEPFPTSCLWYRSLMSLMNVLCVAKLDRYIGSMYADASLYRAQVQWPIDAVAALSTIPICVSGLPIAFV